MPGGQRLFPRTDKEEGSVTVLQPLGQSSFIVSWVLGSVPVTFLLPSRVSLAPAVGRAPSRRGDGWLPKAHALHPPELITPLKI